MLTKTHLVIGLATALYFLPYVRNEFVFVLVIMISTLLPDVDSGFSALGRKIIFRPVQAVTSHRGILHTYTFCIFVSLILALFFPLVALPFFLGYSVHLFADSFTVQGIKPLWPLKYESKGPVRTGGSVESAVFFVFSIIDLVLIITVFARFF